MIRASAVLLAALIAVPAIAQQGTPPNGIILTVDPRPGPMPGENIYLREGFAPYDDYMFPDMAVKDLKIDGDTLFVLVANEGKVASQASARITALAENGGMKSEPAVATTGRLKAGESRWVSLRGFSVKTAATSGQVFALESATNVAASASLPKARPAALDRSGQGCEQCEDRNPDNDQLSLAGTAIQRGKPE